MLKSMTGYGRANQTVAGLDITVEIKSVNHRFYDFNIRIPRIYGALEDKIKKYIGKTVSRGKVDVYISIFDTNEDSAEVKIDKALLSGYLKCLYEMEKEFSLKSDISVMSVARYNDIFTVKKNEIDSDEMFANLVPVIDKALSDFENMRINEGKQLCSDIKDYCNNISENVEYIKTRAPLVMDEYREKVANRMKELLEGNFDESRVFAEASIFADKTAVNEETARLDSHIKQLRDLLCGNVPSGKKLDFLIQEMNRETNTIGSKTTDMSITQKVIDTKNEIEKIREQIQNLE